MKCLQVTLYFLLFTLAAYLLMVQTSTLIITITIIILAFLFISSRYLSCLLYLRDSLEIILLCILLLFTYQQLGIANLIPVPHIITLLILFLYFVMQRKYSGLKKIIAAGRPGNAWWLSLLLAVGSIAGLMLWFYFQDGNPWQNRIPQASTPLLLLMGIGFAFLNAFYEEFIFRGALLTIFTEAVGFIPALVLQAVWFSFLHYRFGFPSGFYGILLTLTFGLVTGYLVKRTRGLLAPVLIHAIADFSIYVMIVDRMKGLF